LQAIKEDYSKFGEESKTYIDDFFEVAEIMRDFFQYVDRAPSSINQTRSVDEQEYFAASFGIGPLAACCQGYFHE
jgi:hypothetical protein